MAYYVATLQGQGGLTYKQPSLCDSLLPTYYAISRFHHVYLLRSVTGGDLRL